MNRIRELRLALGYRQKDLAEMIGCAENSISNYEKEVRALDPGLINRLCEIFDCSADYLLCRSDRKKEEPVGQPAELSEGEYALIRAYRAADERARGMVDLALEPFMAPGEDRRAQSTAG